MAHGVQDHASIVYKDSVYIFGGILHDASYTNKLYEIRSFPPVGNFIVPGVVQPTARAGHSAILHNPQVNLRWEVKHKCCFERCYVL